MAIELTNALTRVPCTLTPLNARHHPLSFELTYGQRFRLGRSATCDKSFLGDYRISDMHASLLLDGDSVVVEDTSVNGTYVNGIRVPKYERRALSSGDQLFLVIPDQSLLQSPAAGSLTRNFVGYTFRSGASPAAAQAPAAATPAGTTSSGPPPPPPPPPSERGAGSDAGGERIALHKLRGRLPRAAPDSPTSPARAPAAPAALSRLSAVRQTRDEQAWIEARIGHCDATGEPSDTEAGGVLGATQPLDHSAFTASDACGGAAVARSVGAEHRSFADWWLANLAQF